MNDASSSASSSIAAAPYSSTSHTPVTPTTTTSSPDPLPPSSANDEHDNSPSAPAAAAAVGGNDTASRPHPRHPNDCPDWPTNAAVAATSSRDQTHAVPVGAESSRRRGPPDRISQQQTHHHAAITATAANSPSGSHVVNSRHTGTGDITGAGAASSSHGASGGSQGVSHVGSQGQFVPCAAGCKSVQQQQHSVLYTDEYDSPLRENVKIVVVGDSGCGKSKLVYAQACRRTFSEAELNSCYVPTIWAIDQYKYRRDVQQLAHSCVDGAHVTVRIWDTFGDHSKDRYFAYQNADVVVLCFSLCDRTSLKNAQSRWLKEIRHFLKNIPVVLAGTMLDMRWKDLKAHNKTRSKFNRKISQADIVSPDEAREACEGVGLPYYESTVLTGYGVSDTFENATRAALVHRRSARMYTMNHLRKVREPQLQPPCLPPEPSYPQLPPIVQSTYMRDVGSLQSAEESADVILCSGSSKWFVHRLLLVQSSDLFSVLFQHHSQSHNTLHHILGGGELSDTGGDSDLDSEHNGEENRYSTSEGGIGGGLKHSDFFLHGLPILRLLSPPNYILHPPQTRTLVPSAPLSSSPPPLDEELGEVAIHMDIPRTHVAAIVHFVYHLSLPPPERLNCSLHDLMYTANLFKMPDLVLLLRSVGASVNGGAVDYKSSSSSRGSHLPNQQLPPVGVHCRSPPPPLLLSVGSRGHNQNQLASSSNSSLNSCSSSSENNLSNLQHSVSASSSHNNHCGNNRKQLQSEIEQTLVLKRQEFLKRHFVQQQQQQQVSEVCGGLGDFAFHVQKETIWVHKYLLAARSKYMSSLLSGSFREAQGRDLLLADISAEAMRVVLCYLYTDQLVPDSGGGIQCVDWSEAIELANRLCLDRLISLIEHEVVHSLTTRHTHSEGVKECMVLVDKCSLFNAHGLHRWTFTHLSHNYDFMCRHFSYLKHTLLSHDTQQLLLHNRWPPVWYIKEKDYFERRSRLLAKVETDKRQMRSGMSRWWLWRKQNFH